MSIFFHIDVNSAFLSWSAIRKLNNGSEIDVRDIPSIIGGDTKTRHGIVLAKSIPAKKYGISTAEPIVSALRKCPTLMIEPPDHAYYEEQSKLLMDYLRELSPRIEQVSIDECYMDFTPIAKDYPSPEIAAHMIKEEVKARFGFTVNVGISDRKVLAKMASDFKKPDLVHTLYHHEIAKKMWPLPISSLYMCGKSSVDALKKLEILTIGDLAKADPSIIRLHLKSHGTLLHDYANGIDTSEVADTQSELKGIGNSTTLSKDAETFEEIAPVLLRLAESVGRRLRAHDKCCMMVSVEIRYSDFTNVSHQTVLPTPTNSDDTIYKIACDLSKKLWDHRPVRLLGIRTSKLTETTEPTQLNLFTMNAETNDEKHRKLDAALDLIKEKYGDKAVMRASRIQGPYDDVKE